MKREQMETLGWTGEKLNRSQSAVKKKQVHLHDLFGTERHQEMCRQTNTRTKLDTAADVFLLTWRQGLTSGI